MCVCVHVRECVWRMLLPSHFESVSPSLPGLLQHWQFPVRHRSELTCPDAATAASVSAARSRKRESFHVSGQTNRLGGCDAADHAGAVVLMPAPGLLVCWLVGARVVTPTAFDRRIVHLAPERGSGQRSCRSQFGHGPR